ncbi:MAG: signal recognition particle subunit [Archaeoglobaceae archaeon]|nr:signal recognition particle subunit [Archaeoglobaceae archaeon]MDK2877161.1 signal recognition particle subunit [Archaeoglobaceae archaeon]
MKHVIWVSNLEAKKTRAEGRKIARRFAVPNVRLQEIVQACKELGLSFEVENKKYPRSWWEEGGRVIIDGDKNKTKLMIEIASKILEIRERKKKK